MQTSLFAKTLYTETHSTMWTRCVGLSHITQVHQWAPKWCPTVPFSSDAGQVSGTQAERSVLTDLHSSGSVRGKYRQQSSKTPSCKLMVLSAVGQRVLGIQGSTLIGLLYRILPETLITIRKKKFTGQGIETRVSFLLDTLTPFRLPGVQQPGSSLEVLTEPPIISNSLPLPRK